MTPTRLTGRFPRRSALLAGGCLLTVGVAVLLAHEGHAPLPTRGAQVDTRKGYLILSADARTAIDVETAAVELRPVEEKVLAYAALVAPWTSHGFATTRLPGRVTRVLVSPGQKVRAGDILAEVESLELESLQLDVLTARNDIRIAEKLSVELRKLADAGAVAGQEALEAEAKLGQGRNALAVARGKWLGLGLPADKLDDLLRRGEPLPGLALPVTAPVSGTVVHAELTAGRVVDPADHLAEVTDLSVVWVRIGVLEKDLYRVRVGQPVELRLAAYPGEVFHAAVTAFSPYLDPTGVASAWAELTNPSAADPRFQPGMAGQVHLFVSDGKARPSVPAAAVLREGVERFVLVEEANAAESSEYRKFPVVVGREADGWVAILGGHVFPGDRVVTRGASLLGPYFTPEVLKPGEYAEREIGLKVEPARVVTLDEVVAVDGAVEVPPDRRGFAASPLAGTVLAVRAGRGQPVKSGDVVAEVFSPELLAVQQELLRAHLESALAADTLARLRKVSGGAARRVWELESQLASLKAQADTARRKLTTAGLTAAQIDGILAEQKLVPAVPVRAPLAGVVVTFNRALGEAVAARAPLFEVHDLSRPWVRGLVPEHDVARVRPGQAVRVRTVADPGSVATGRVARSGGTLAGDARVLSVWVELDTAPERPLLHNQLAGLTVVVGQRPPVLAVPRSAVAADGTATFVFVRRPDGVFDRRAVETGPADDRLVAVTRGLAEGETVAVAGVNELMTAYASLR
jgi:membrane fusion protein, heavy metal efflux system